MNGPRLVCCACCSAEVAVGEQLCSDCSDDDGAVEWSDLFPAESASPSACVGCGCTDLRACTGGCSWLAVNHDDGTGVCTSCAGFLAPWRHHQAEPDALRRQALLRALQQEQSVATQPGALDL